MTAVETTVPVAATGVRLGGTLSIPAGAHGVVLFAHGSGSSRHSPRNRRVASVLNDAGLATLLVDLLTEDEEQIDLRTREHRFDIALLAERLVGAADWLTTEEATAALALGCFGASTGAAAALVAAAERPDGVGAVVSRGGRPDLAGDALGRADAPTLLIVGERDPLVLDLNREAMERMHAPVRLEIVASATHLFEEPGTLDVVAQLARDWFLKHLAR